MLKIKLVLILVFLLLISTVSAKTDYNETGNLDGLYEFGTGFFNAQLTDIATFTRTLSDSKLTPLVSDLDGDGVNEIIILDDLTIRLFQNRELDIVDAFTLTGTSRFSNWITFDIDGDGRREIIIAQEIDEKLHIIQYNGTAIINETSFNLDIINHTDGEMMIKCGGVDNCLLIFTNADTSTGGNVFNNLSMLPFSSTTLGNEEIISVNSQGQSVWCFPKVKTMEFTDYDNDGTDEFIFSAVDAFFNGDDKPHIFYISVSGLDGTLEQDIDVNSDNGLVSNMGNLLNSGTGSGCDTSNIGRAFTQPLVFDIDGSSSNGLETAIGFMTDADKFKINTFFSLGSFFDDYPEVEKGEGIIVSNLFRMNAFPDTSNQDFCVVGYDDTDGEIDLLCGSEITSETPETREFTFDISNLYNVTQDYQRWNVISHSAQHSTVTTDGNNLNELVNSYGVFTLNDNCDIFGDCTMNLAFENPKADGVVISVDTEKVDREDLLVLQDTNIWYLDDKFVNQGGVITDFFTNPCIDSTWKVNTSVEIRITVADDEGDDVSAKAILYKDNSNEQDSGFSINTSSGTTFTFAFTANKTIGTGSLQLAGRDVANPTTLDEIDLTFSVGTVGVEFGDCTTDIDLVAVAVEEAEITTATLTQDTTATSDNSVLGGLETFQNLTGLAGTTIWLIIMIVISLGIWTQLLMANNMGASSALGVIAIFNVLMIILGARLGILSTGLVVIIVVLGVVILGVFFGKFITGVRTET